MHHPSRFAAFLLAAACTVLLWLWLNERRLTSRLTLDAATAIGAKKSLQSEIAARVREIDSLRAQMQSEGIIPAIPSPRPAAAPDESKRLEAIRSLARAEQRIATLQAGLSEARERGEQLEAQVENLQAENRKLASAGADTRDDLAKARRVIDASEAEIRSKAERITQLEAAARAARDSQAGGGQRIQQSVALLREFDELNRRRENTLQSLQRRFRDISDQYRAFALRLDTNRDNPAAAMPDVSRIQSTVQAAEDEMRQLDTLNTQSQRLTQKLSALEK